MVHQRSIVSGMTLVGIVAMAAIAQTVSSQPGPTGKPTTAAAPADPMAAVRTAKQVEDLLTETQKSQPEWWNTLQVKCPATLELTWTTPAPRERDPRKYLSQYLQAAVASDATVWKATIKMLHDALAANKADADKTKLTADALGRFYALIEDYPRAAWWYRRGNQDPAALAECYWNLGCRELAAEACDRATNDPTGKAVGILAAMGEPAKAVTLADATAKASPAAVAYVYAADACRKAGQYETAAALYKKGQEAKGSRPKFEQIAGEWVQITPLLTKLDVSKVKDGTYSGTGASGYRGPISVEVVVKAGRILSVRVTDQKEDAAYFNRANAAVPAKIIERQGVKGVDTVTGATISSDTIIAAAVKALAVGMK